MANNHHRPYCLMLLFLMLPFGYLQAALLNFEINGVIIDDDFSDPEESFPSIEPGAAFTGILSYNTDTPEIFGGMDPNFGTYIHEPPFVPLSITIEGNTFQSDAAQPADILIVNDAEDPDFGIVDEVVILTDQVVGPDGFLGRPVEFGLILISLDPLTLPSIDLPLTYDVDDFESRFVFFTAEFPETGNMFNFNGEITSIEPAEDMPTELQAGDADRDFDFDQLDVVRVQIANKYLSGTLATWGEGDWNGAPGGSQNDPPAGDGRFDQLDVVAALRSGTYLTGPYASIIPNGTAEDGQTSIGYDASNGHVWVDAPAGAELTSVNIDSAAAIFTADAAQNLGGSFDNDTDANIFKATFGGSFGSLSLGNVAQAELSQEFLLSDLTVVGSLAGGGALGEVDLIYVPEPAALVLLIWGVVWLGLRRKV